MTKERVRYKRKKERKKEKRITERKEETNKQTKRKNLNFVLNHNFKSLPQSFYFIKSPDVLQYFTY
jgi:hypothetical protein